MATAAAVSFLEGEERREARSKAFTLFVRLLKRAKPKTTSKSKLTGQVRFSFFRWETEDPQPGGAPAVTAAISARCLQQQPPGRSSVAPVRFLRDNGENRKVTSSLGLKDDICLEVPGRKGGHHLWGK